MVHPGDRFRDTQALAQSQLGGGSGIPAVSLTQRLGQSTDRGLASSQPGGCVSVRGHRCGATWPAGGCWEKGGPKPRLCFVSDSAWDGGNRCDPRRGLRTGKQRHRGGEGALSATGYTSPIHASLSVENFLVLDLHPQCMHIATYMYCLAVRPCTS